MQLGALVKLTNKLKQITSIKEKGHLLMQMTFRDEIFYFNDLFSQEEVN